MILFFFALAGVLIGLAVNRGRVRYALEGATRIHWLWLPVLGALLDSSLRWLPPGLTLPYAAPVTCAAYLCILAFLFRNRAEAVPAGMMAAGALSNFCVIAANGFRMPVSPAALAMYPGMTPEAVLARRVNYFVAVNGANLYYLGDVIPVPFRGLDGFLSVGDLLLGVGLALFLIAVMTRRTEEEKAGHAAA